jgi:hypothetical protein
MSGLPHIPPHLGPWALLSNFQKARGNYDFTTLQALFKVPSAKCLVPHRPPKTLKHQWVSSLLHLAVGISQQASQRNLVF